MGVRQRMFSPVFGSHLSGRFCPFAIPEAPGPRNDGQLPLLIVAVRPTGAEVPLVSVIARVGIVLTSLAGDQVLRSTITLRISQGSEITLNPTFVLSVRTL